MNASKKYQITVILNDVTMQVFVTINHLEAQKKGLYAVIADYHRLLSRLRRQLGGADTNKFFDSGINWALSNSAEDNFYDLPTLTGFETFEDAVAAAESQTADFVAMGYADVRVRYVGSSQAASIEKINGAV